MEKSRIQNYYRILCSPAGLAILISGIIFTGILIPVWWQSTNWVESRFVADEKLAAQEALLVISESAYATVNNESLNLFWINREIQRDPDTQDYHGILARAYRDISARDPSARTLSLKPKGADEVFYPQNKTGGQDHTQNSFELRSPVFVNARYWGLSGITLDSGQVFSDSIAVNGYARQYEIAVVGAGNAELYGDADIFNQDPVVRRLVLLKGTELRIAGVPRGGWAAATEERVFPLRWLGFSIIVLAALLIALVVYRQASLNLQIRCHRKKIQETQGLLSLEQTRHHQADLENESSRVKFFTLFNNTSDVLAVCRTDSSGSPHRFLEVNDSMCRMLGYTCEELRMHSLGDPELFVGFNGLRPQIIAELTGSGHSTFVLDCLSKSGAIIPFEFNVHRFTANKSDLLMAIGRNISERRSIEKSLRRSIAEKEVLLRELHHRTKNDLQIIISMIDLQAMSIDNPLCRQKFIDCENRIRSMGLVHETLYHSPAVSKVNSREYFEKLVGQIGQSYRTGCTIAISLEIDEIDFDPDTATSCGFITYELVTNTFRHAFIGKNDGRITISLKKQNNGSCDLLVTDNGIGFPEHIDIDTSESVGMQIVSAFVGQLHGTLSVSRDNGTTVKVNFSIRRDGGRP